MKKVFLFAMTALLLAAPASAQQKKTVKKRTTVAAAKRTTAAPRKKTASQPVKIEMDEPCIAGGAVAFNGIPVTLSNAEIASELTSQGFQFKKDEFGNEAWYGKAFGVEGQVYVEKDPARVSFVEKKTYTKSQVRKRIMAYKDAFEELSGCTATESTMSWNSDEGGMVKILINGGYIEMDYNNEDEVNFMSNYFVLRIVFAEH